MEDIHTKSGGEDNEVTKYVAGFMISEDTKRVALIRKTRPRWQAGLLNGIGGKVEAGESCKAAMIREFKEETGYRQDMWFNFLHLHGNGWSVEMYLTYGDVDALKTTTDEEVVVLQVNDINFDLCVSNLSWIIPLTMNGELVRADVFENVPDGILLDSLVEKKDG